MDPCILEDASARLRQRLHDGLGQSLSLAAMQIDQAMAGGARDDALPRTRALLRDALQEVRSLIASIDPQARNAAPPDLAAQLHACVRRLNARQPIPVDCTIEGPPLAVPVPACEALLSATRELLVNACKHGRSARVEVRVAFRPGRLNITVTGRPAPDGREPRSAPVPGFGLGLRATHHGLDRIGARLRWRHDGADVVHARISWVPR